MSTLEHLMGVTFTTSLCPSPLWKRPCYLKWDPRTAFSGLEEKYLQLLKKKSYLFDSTVHDSKIDMTILNRCHGRVAGSHPRNCITVAHKTRCCLVY